MLRENMLNWPTVKRTQAEIWKYGIKLMNISECK